MLDDINGLFSVDLPEARQGLQSQPFLRSSGGEAEEVFSKDGHLDRRKNRGSSGVFRKRRGLQVGDIFGDFHNNRLRNAVAHSDYILTDADVLHSSSP
jgi:hypothetical protein